LGERKGDDEAAIELALTREARVESHRRRAVRPDPDGVCSLPFLLAHVEMIVACGAPPVDAARLFAGDEAAELPEVLAGAGAAPAMQTVNHSRSDLARLQDEPRHRSGKRAACAARLLRCP